MDNDIPADGLAVRDRFIAYVAKAGGATHPVALGDTIWLAHLARTAFLLTPTVGSFLQVTVPALLRMLSCSTEAKPVEMQGAICGRVDWAASWKARHTGDPNPALFVCRQVERQYATPENELLRYVLEKLKLALAEIPAVLRIGVCWSVRGVNQPASIYPVLANRQDLVQRHLRHAALRKIAPPDSITSQHLRRARSSKTEEYSDVANLYRDYTKLLTDIQNGSAVAMLKECVMLPASLAGPGEDLVKSAALGVMSQSARSPGGSVGNRLF